MARMLPWIKTFWATLDEADKKEIAKYARLICKTAVLDSGREACLERLEEICNKYPALEADCHPVLESDNFANGRIVAYSEIEFLTNYFSQFADLYPEESWSVPEGNKRERRFVVRNDYHGTIVCTLQGESAGKYTFKYIKDGVEVFRDWNVLKRGGRVIEELFT